MQVGAGVPQTSKAHTFIKLPMVACSDLDTGKIYFALSKELFLNFLPALVQIF